MDLKLPLLYKKDVASRDNLDALGPKIRFLKEYMNTLFTS